MEDVSLEADLFKKLAEFCNCDPDRPGETATILRDPPHEFNHAKEVQLTKPSWATGDTPSPQPTHLIASEHAEVQLPTVTQQLILSLMCGLNLQQLKNNLLDN